jgi:hypothetical protein
MFDIRGNHGIEERCALSKESSCNYSAVRIELGNPRSLRYKKIVSFAEDST